MLVNNHLDSLRGKRGYVWPSLHGAMPFTPKPNPLEAFRANVGEV